MSGRVQDLSLVLCLLLRRVCCDVMQEDLHLVDGLIHQHITLPCSFTIPDNWKDQEIHITWYRNYTDKLLDCSVKHGMSPVCQEYPDSSRVQLLWKFHGNGDLDIYSLRESDEGQYQCWIIFDDAYQRQDTVLRVHSDTGTRREESLLQGFVKWQKMLVVSTWNVLLLIGWPIAIFLAGVLLSQRCHSHRIKKFSLI